MLLYKDTACRDFPAGGVFLFQLSSKLSLFEPSLEKGGVFGF